MTSALTKKFTNDSLFFHKFPPMLKDTLYADMTAAMKARDSIKTGTLRMVKAEIMKHETSSAEAEATDEVVIQFLKKSVKQRHEAAEGFDKGGNTEMAEKERKEAEILQAYLPEQMSEEEVKKVVAETISEVGASGPGDMGKVMGAVMGKLQGKADGGMVKDAVQAALS